MVYRSTKGGYKFDSKTWGPQITESKRKWKEKKRLAKLKQAPE